jgi:thiamine biosynthesis protein ThiI
MTRIDTIIVNSAEIILKGANRRLFERQLMDNIRSALRGLPDFRLERRQASFFLVWPDKLDQDSLAEVERRLGLTFGVAQYMPAERVDRDMGSICDKAAEAAIGLPDGTFKVEARRLDKSFPLKSPEIAREAGAAALKANHGLKVDLRQPAAVIRVLVDAECGYVALNPRSGPSGLPVGVSGRVVSLLSGGIDSPVASWRMASRGCQVILVHCHSYPYVSQQSLDKVKRLAAVLAEWLGGTQLYLLSFADIQQAIVAKGQEANRVVLYRRAMLRLAESLAEREGALGLVTGDSVGQVASQTLENINAVSRAVSLPIYRPLCGDDKETITRQAQRIGSYELSVEPHDDCCSLFTPDHPVTRSRPAELAADEARYDWAGLIEKCLKEAERINFDRHGQILDR